MSPSVILFAAAMIGSYAGFLSALGASAWFLMACAIGACGLIIRARAIRAVCVFGCILATAAFLAKGRLNNFESILGRIPKGYVEITGIIEESVPTLLSGKRLQFLADGGYRLKVYLKDGAALTSVSAGDRLKLLGQVKRLHHALAPGDFDAYWLGLARSFHGHMTVSSPFKVRILSPRPLSRGPWLPGQSRDDLRQRLLEVLNPRQASILLALIVGETDFFERDQKEIYTNVGAGHLLAVSGLQVGCLSFIFFWLFKLFLLFMPGVGRLSRTRFPAVILTLAAIWGFTLLSGSSASVVRATLMSSLALLGLILGRDNSVLDAFGIAGFLSVIIAPQSVFDPSFLFSYLAIFGLLISGNILAGIVTVPLSLYYFGAVALGGVLVNLVLIPISVFLQTPAILLASIGLYKPAAAFAGALESLCEALGDWLGGLWWFSPPHALQVVGLIVAFTFFAHKHRLNAALLSALLFVPGYFGELEGVKITVLPVGQGDSSVFEFPNGQVMVIDGGPREEYLLRFLRQRHIKKIDIMVLSHPDADHLVGLLKVLAEMPVREIWHSGFSGDVGLMKAFLQVANEKKAQVKIASQIIGGHQFGKVGVTILAPSNFDQNHTTNNNSLVVKIKYGSSSVLWPGDIELDAEKQADQAWESDMVKVPHHGSRTSSSAYFINQVRAKQVVYCTAPDNQFAFPHEEVKKRWADAGVRAWDTAEHGLLQVFLTGNQVITKPFLVSNKT